MTTKLATRTTSFGPETLDAELLEACRDDVTGVEEAYAELWRRHLPTAHAVANRWGGRRCPEDTVAEASARVFSLIRNGRGPRENFRAYFLTTVRTIAIDDARRNQRALPTEDDTLEHLAEPVPEPVLDPAVEDIGFDADLVRQAFAELSEADQRVLWHTTVEGAKPRAVAVELGMSPNGVSVRAMRARNALRSRYLEAYATERGMGAADSAECRWAITQIGALSRGKVPKRHQARLDAHLAQCPHAAAVAFEVQTVHDRMPALLVPLIFAAGLSTKGFLSDPTLAALGGGSTASASVSQETARAVSIGSNSLRNTMPAVSAVSAAVAAIAFAVHPMTPPVSSPPRAAAGAPPAHAATTLSPTLAPLPVSDPVTPSAGLAAPARTAIPPISRARSAPRASTLNAAHPGPRPKPSTPTPATPPQSTPEPWPGPMQHRPCRPFAATDIPTIGPAHTYPPHRPNCPPGHGSPVPTNPLPTSPVNRHGGVSDGTVVLALVSKGSPRPASGRRR